MKHFSRAEFACKCGCGENKIADDFVAKLNVLCAEVPEAIVVTSGYRCPTHNAAVSKTGLTGPHTTGRAADLALQGRRAVELLTLALAGGQFTGFGLNQKGAGRFLHLDDLPNAAGQPRPHCWTY